MLLKRGRSSSSNPVSFITCWDFCGSRSRGSKERVYDATNLNRAGSNFSLFLQFGNQGKVTESLSQGKWSENRESNTESIKLLQLLIPIDLTSNFLPPSLPTYLSFSFLHRVIHMNKSRGRIKGKRNNCR